MTPASAPHPLHSSLTSSSLPSLDHILICTPVNADAAASRLTALGLTEGSPNAHAGQGTACRRFFFRNAYIELLWVFDADQARSDLSRPTHLWDRWSSRAAGTSPFGLCFRPEAGHDTAPPFETWEYRPAYLPSPLSIHLSRGCANIQEPMLFHLAFASRPDAAPPSKRQPLDHPLGLKEISSVTLVGPHPAPLSPHLASVVRSGLATLQDGADHRIELGFDGQPAGRSADLRPALPMILHW